MSVEIVIQNLFKKYRNGTEALKGVDLEISKGQFFTLLGPNGAGKSSLVKILTTLITKDSGSMTINGINPEKSPALISRYIGVALQENDLDPAENTFNLLLFQARLFGMSKNEALKRAETLINDFRLQEVKDKKVEILSGGNKRRLHCALALVHRPQILFLDEPTVGMDPEARDNFWKVITRMNKEEGITIFLTTQYLDEADAYASEMAFLYEGSIMYKGSISGFKKKVHSSDNISLNDSYLKYIQSISNHELKNN